MMHLPTSRRRSKSLCSNSKADVGVTGASRNSWINRTIAQIGSYTRRNTSGDNDEIDGIANNGARKLHSFIEASFPQDWRTLVGPPVFLGKAPRFTTVHP